MKSYVKTWPPDLNTMPFATSLYSPLSYVASWSQRQETNTDVQMLVVSSIFHENNHLRSGILPGFCFVSFSILEDI